MGRLTAGTAFAVAGRALLDALADRPAMADWQVRYDPPRDDRDLTGPAGARQAIWVDPEGDSTYDLTTLPSGIDETVRLAVVFEVIDPMSAASQYAVDELAAAAVGELLDLTTTDPHLDGADLPDGWDIAWCRFDATAREGGPVEDRPGYGRRITVDLTIRTSRCTP